MCTKLEKHKEKCVMDDLKNIFQAIVNTCKKNAQTLCVCTKHHKCSQIPLSKVKRRPHHKTPRNTRGKLLFNPNDRKATLHIRKARKQK